MTKQKLKIAKEEKFGHFVSSYLNFFVNSNVSIFFFDFCHQMNNKQQKNK